MCGSNTKIVWTVQAFHGYEDTSDDLECMKHPHLAMHLVNNGSCCELSILNTTELLCLQ